MKPKKKNGIGALLLTAWGKPPPLRTPKTSRGSRVLPRSFLRSTRRSARQTSKRSKPQQPDLQMPAIASAPAPQALAPIELANAHGRLRDSIEGFLLDQRSPHTRRAYGKDLKRFVAFLIAQKGGDAFASIDRTAIVRYKDQLLSEGLAQTSIDRHLATLKSFFRWLVEDGVLPKSPAENVRFLNPRKLSTTQGFTNEEVVRILAQPNLHQRTGSLHYAVLMVLFYCGLRRSELCAIRTNQVRKEREQWVVRLQGKGGLERIVVIPPSAWKAIQHYLAITRRTLIGDRPLFSAIRTTKGGDQPLDPSLVYYIVTRYAKEAGVQGRVSPHSCRATAISNARDRQVPDRAIQEFAGWASPDMITRYDKRRTAIDQSASLAISYGSGERALPVRIDQSIEAALETTQEMRHTKTGL